MSLIPPDIETLALNTERLALEALKEIFDYLGSKVGIKEVRAWSDNRNVASHRLAERLGMRQIEFIKDADFFRGATSDEYVFALQLRQSEGVQ